MAHTRLIAYLVGVLIFTTSNASWTSQFVQADLRLAAGAYHVCALTDTGKVFCWGRNDSGQLGNGTFVDSKIPTEVVGLATRAQGISAGPAHTCALLIDGSVACWGSNLGNAFGTVPGENFQKPVLAWAGGNFRASSIDAGEFATCVVLISGQSSCWGDNTFGRFGVDIPSGHPISASGWTTPTRQVVVGPAHACGLSNTNEVTCAGRAGRIGFSTDTNVIAPSSYHYPTKIPGLSAKFSSISAGNFHSCGVTSDGAVFCWGEDFLGTLGASPIVSRGVIKVGGLPSRIAKVSAGYDKNCALDVMGQIYCWGGGFATTSGRTTLPPVIPPAKITRSEHTAIAVATGDVHACAILSDESVICWGDNAYGQLGNDSLTASGSNPVRVFGLSLAAEQVAAPASSYGAIAILILFVVLISFNAQKTKTV